MTVPTDCNLCGARGDIFLVSGWRARGDEQRAIGDNEHAIDPTKGWRVYEKRRLNRHWQRGKFTSPIFINQLKVFPTITDPSTNIQLGQIIMLSEFRPIQFIILNPWSGIKILSTI